MKIQRPSPGRVCLMAQSLSLYIYIIIYYICQRERERAIYIYIDTYIHCLYRGLNLALLRKLIVSSSGDAKVRLFSKTHWDFERWTHGNLT